MSTVERPTGPMHETIRRVYEEIRVYSNYYAAIKIVTAALAQAKDNDRNAGVSSAPSFKSSLDPLNGVSKSNIDVSVENGQVGSCVVAAATSPSQRKSLSTTQNVVQGVVMQRETPEKNRSAPQGLVLNRLQKLQLLLLRADAFSATKQHDKALEDAQAAAQLSRGLSPEAYFIMGRELLRLFRVVDSVKSFEKAESILLMSLASRRNLVADEATDEDFWAQRGFQMADVERLQLKRSEGELQEQAASDASVRDGNDTQPASALSSPNVLDHVARDDEVGYTTDELIQWRQLAREARALLTMRTSHVLPIDMLQTTLPLLDRRVGSARNGLVACVENTTARMFRLMGCSSPDASFYAGMYFPDTIPSGCCGLALLQPRGWGGFVGSACYEVADNGVCCFFCFECSFMGTVKCGVRFVSEQRSAEWGLPFRDLGGVSGTPASSTSSKGFASFKIPSPSVWVSMHVAPLVSGRKLKVWCTTHENNRAITFSVMEVLPIHLRSVELLTALEFAGPAVLKRMSAVSRRYRELINNLPPPMFYGAGRRSYPDYCLRSDRVSSPWVVRDKGPVKWNYAFDGRSVNRDNFLLTDPTNPQNTILLFSSERSGSVEAMVYYGDRRSPIVHIKGSWVPFSNTLYFCTPAGRTFASCYLNHSSQLSLAWDGAGSKSKAEDVEYVMCRNEPARTRESGAWMGCTPTISTVSSSSSIDSSSVTTFPHAGGGPAVSFAPGGRGSRGSAFESHCIWRPVRRSGSAVVGSTPNQTSGGMELVAEVTVHTPLTNVLLKDSPIGEIRMLPGADALLVALMAYCRFQWEG